MRSLIADEVVVDVAEVVALVEFEPRHLGDLVHGASEEVALRRDDLAHRDELTLEREQALSWCSVGSARTAASSTSISSSVSASSGKEAVGERVEDAVEQELLAVQPTAVQELALAVEGWQAGRDGS